MNPLRAPVGLVVAAFAATIAFHPVLEAEAAEERRIVVEIRKFKFVPATLAVRPGDVVVWRNMDIVPHTATAKGDGWDSGTIEAGGEGTTTVTEDMPGAYYCRFHPSMVASLDVTSE